jgi:uncharacterized protein (TIGR02246 family)
MSRSLIVRYIAAVALLSGIALTSACVTIETSDSSLEEVEKVERARFQAWVRKDTTALRQVIADDVVYCHSTGVCQNKEELIAFITGANSAYRAMDVVELKPRVFGDAVVINGKLAMEVESAGQVSAFQGIYTDVYVKRDGRWQLVQWQSTRLP